MRERSSRGGDDLGQDAAPQGAQAMAHQIHGVRGISGLRSMSICAHDGRHLADLRRDQSQPLFGRPKKVDLNVDAKQPSQTRIP
jgi:hypothetical protein